MARFWGISAFGRGFGGLLCALEAPPLNLLHFKVRVKGTQVKSSCCSPNFIEQTAHCDHKPRASSVFFLLSAHRQIGIFTVGASRSKIQRTAAMLRSSSGLPAKNRFGIHKNKKNAGGLPKAAMAHCPRPNAGLWPPLGPLKGTGTPWGNGVFVCVCFFFFLLYPECVLKQKNA